MNVSPNLPLELIEHRSDILGEAHGFGGFLFDASGKLVMKDGLGWLYTTAVAGEKWESWVRPFNFRTFQAGSPTRVLLPRPGDDRAVLHHVVAITEQLFVGLYCDGLGVGAAIASAPDGQFSRDDAFVLRPEVGWETRGGPADGWSLESNGAYLLYSDTAKETIFWQGYDSYYYRKHGSLGDLGWAKVRVEKGSGRVSLLNRHPRNPLAFRKPDWRAARCGGNLAIDVLIAGKRPFFYYIKRETGPIVIGIALSNDPIFLNDTEHSVMDVMLGGEEVAEKFEALQVGNELILFYQSRMSSAARADGPSFNDNSWRTSLRRYRIL
ncbi:MAG: hypothetical protein EOS61_02935 [Mesorhizobium sp.]|uniref:hypothetical protein n=1 Tax=Mesorhizobium sp. TaxID=1871066 RepID=UPI000FE46DD2|nr:hypothetical protein [Mesorhizobium sp.]RWB94148.1 MAG: hypothetical protein EOQ57_32505 [Mesorhizobium sp.]RWE17414.1 MAG: hypothetical protein EOS61_02935 [Mesorhizobium sp.]TIS44429.1 MAG: hypothetical protein E5W96_36445 [Mesorhizobium sp.]